MAQGMAPKLVFLTNLPINVNVILNHLATEKFCWVWRRHACQSIVSSRSTEATMPSKELTRKPVSLSTTISGRAPFFIAKTGIPEIMDSIGTN